MGTFHLMKFMDSFAPCAPWNIVCDTSVPPGFLTPPIIWKILLYCWMFWCYLNAKDFSKLCILSSTETSCLQCCKTKFWGLVQTKYWLLRVMEQLLTQIGMQGITHLNLNVGSVSQVSCTEAPSRNYSHNCMKTEIHSLWGDLCSRLTADIVWVSLCTESWLTRRHRR